jgi:hypothetical protein
LEVRWKLAGWIGGHSTADIIDEGEIKGISAA